MSDPVSNAEIEDVLSSIRRLVSEDASPLHKRKRIAEGAKERFVLTPALRVAENDAQEDEVTETSSLRSDSLLNLRDPSMASAQTADAAPEEPASVEQIPQVSAEDDRYARHRQTLEQRIAELEAALQQAPDEWEPDGSEVAEAAHPSIPSFDTVQDATEDETAQPDVSESQDGWRSDMVEDEILAAIIAEDAVAQTAEAETIVEEDTAQPVEAQDFFAAPEIREASETPEVESTADEAENLLREHVPEPEPEEWQDADAIEDDTAEAGSAFDMDFRSERNGAQEQASRQYNPQLPSDDEVADDADADNFDMFAEDTVLDEAALREMVAQLVREELQGVLGERITRNVRRLVRREIQRALTVRDLD